MFGETVPICPVPATPVRVTVLANSSVPIEPVRALGPYKGSVISTSNAFMCKVRVRAVALTPVTGNSRSYNAIACSSILSSTIKGISSIIERHVLLL
jgi:hypothetical protein